MGLLAVGAAASNYMTGVPKPKQVNTVREGFASGSYPARTARTTTPTGELDIQYALPTGGSVLMEPYPSDTQGLPTSYASRSELETFSDSASPAIHERGSSIKPSIIMRNDGIEETPNYQRGARVISPLTGIEYTSTEFTHNNMVPFFRGSVKQNMSDTGNRNILDTYTGAASTQFNKQEQGPMFDLQREPTGNVNGLESHSDFLQDRIVGPQNRAMEKPFESVRVGKGLAQGYTSVPSGGFQQAESLDFARPRGTDELRVANNPKMTYAGAILPGKSQVTNRGETGEVRKYMPDRFFINKNGERNFAGGGVVQRDRMRAMEILKHQARTETTREHIGPAGAVEAKKEYQIPSFRAPMVSQFGEFGWRNADGSRFFNKNTDIETNDYGKMAIEIKPNERYFTGDRVHGLNLKPDQREISVPLQDKAKHTRAQELVANIRGTGNFSALGAGVPGSMTVYDPNDIARTTIKETTIDNDWLGIAGPADGPTKLTIYDPEDIARVTGRNTLAEPDKVMNISLQGVPNKPQLSNPDGVRYTQKAAISAKSDYTGNAATVEGKKARLYGAEYKMRHYAQKETISSGRTPIAGNGNLPLFNGEEYMNVMYKKLESDIVNERQPPVYRVNGPPSGAEVIGIVKPRSPLELDMGSSRFNPASIKPLQNNPFNIDITRTSMSAYADYDS